MGSELGPARSLWMATMPRLTEGVIRRELIAMGLLSPPDGLRENELATAGSLISTEQWLELRRRCAYKAGIDDYDATELEQLLSGPLGARWREELRQRKEDLARRSVGIEERIERALERLEQP